MYDSTTDSSREGGVIRHGTFSRSFQGLKGWAGLGQVRYIGWSTAAGNLAFGFAISFFSHDGASQWLRHCIYLGQWVGRSVTTGFANIVWLAAKKPMHTLFRVPEYRIF